MSFTEEEKKKALQLYDETGSIAKVIHNLGYPSRQNMYTWIKNRNIEKKHKEYSKIEILKRNTRNIVLLIHQTIGFIHRWKQNLKYFTVALKKEKT